MAIQSFLKAGFLSAVQLELLFMIGGVFNPLQTKSGLRVSGILFLNMLSTANSFSWMRKGRRTLSAPKAGRRREPTLGILFRTEIWRASIAQSAIACATEQQFAPGLSEFAPLGGAGCCFRLRLRLKGS